LRLISSFALLLFLFLAHLCIQQRLEVREKNRVTFFL
jgi:hypothetical protein